MAGGTSIDQLYIEIDAKAVKANDSIDKLCGKLDRLSASISKINGAQFNNLASGIQRLGSAMQTMGTVKTADFTRLAKNIEKIGTLNVANINNAAASIQRISNAFNNLGPVSDNAKKFSELARGIAQLGYKSSTQAIENIPKLAKAMNELMTTLSKAPKVSRNLIDMTNALAKLSRTGASSGRAVNSLSKSFTGFSSASKKAQLSSFSLASAIGKVYATYWMFFRAFKYIKKAIDISSDLTEVQNVVDVTFGKYRNLVEEMSESSIIDFGMSELTVKQISSRFQAMGTAMGMSNKMVADSSEFLAKKGVKAYGDLGKSMANMSVNLTKLAADMASFYNVEQKDVAEDLEAIFTGQTRPLRTYGLDLTQATLKEWALKNGLDANIESMSQMEKAVLRYQYVMANTGAAQGDFARTADTWANQVRILKQNFEQLGIVLGSTLISAFKPIVKGLNVVISKFIEFATVVSNSLGKIFGWTYEAGGGITSDLEESEVAADGISDGMGGAADNAKKLKQQLQGFDELNVLSSNDTSGGGSGGVGTGAIGGVGDTGGQWVQTESLLDQYESELDNLWKLGNYISERITESLNNIDWEKTYEGARGFGAGLAAFLNGLISPELFSALGSTIAGSINTAIEAAYSFVKVFQWDEFGKSIGAGINSCLDDTDFTKLMQTISGVVSGIYDTLSSAIQEIDWRQLGVQIIQFIKNIDWGNMVSSLFELFGSVLGGLLDFVGGVVSEAFDGIADFITKHMNNTGGYVIEGLLRGIVEALSNLAKWIKDNIFKPFLDGIKKAFDINSPAKTMEEPGRYIIEGLYEGLKSGFENVLDWFGELPKKIKDKLKTAWESVKSWWSENVKLSDIKVPSIGDIKTKVKEAWDNARNYWSNKKTLTEISITIQSVKNKLKDAWTKARNWWNNNKPSLSQITAKIKIPRLVITWDTTGAAAKALQKLGLKGFPNFAVKYYAMGGFPEDGWFRANHGELMGKFDNGRTVVANNKQITAGIAQAVYDGNRENNSIMRQELELMRRQNELLMDLAEKETGISAKDMFDSVRKSADDYKRRTGRPAFAY